MRIPVLTYHSMNIAGGTYGENDHVAFAADLRLVTRLGLRVVPLNALVDALLTGSGALDDGRFVAMSCDDGPDFDYRDLPHPTAGPTRSMLNILRDFVREEPRAQPDLHLTAFVIASPSARETLDRTCMLGKAWWNDEWWPAAVASGLMGIGNHSWDHNHGSLQGECAAGVPRGSFAVIDGLAGADFEIAQASRYIASHAPNACMDLFAYPYSEHNPFLVEEYLPRRGAAIGVRAAFAGEPRFVEAASDRWKLPRFVCGADWKSSDELERLLRELRTA